MPLQHNLKLVVNKLMEIRLDFNISNFNSKKSEESNSVKDIVTALMDEPLKGAYIHYCHCNKDLNLLDFLIDILCNTELTCCKDNFSYLAQRERLCCILRNLKKLLCQLHCFDFENIKCELLSKLLCLLLQIIEKIISLVLDLIALEVLCATCGFECKEETFECILCNLIKNINDFEVLINELACLVLEIASQQIINCTTCATNVHPPKYKKHYWSDPCDNDW